MPLGFSPHPPFQGTFSQRWEKDQPVFRFAPSPNGLLHLGHTRSALLNQAWARETGGRLLLRIEDIDLARTREEFVQGIFADLDWLGIEYEKPVRRQSEHFEDYAKAIEQLEQQGLLYPCFCTRKELAQRATQTSIRDPEGTPLYDGTCRHLTKDDIRRRQEEPFALRLDMKKAVSLVPTDIHYDSFEHPSGSITRRRARPKRWGDVILKRKDIPTSYHIAVVVDDALQSITHIVRGKDLEAATDLHRLLQILLDLPAPFYHHHALVTDGQGEKLAKSKGSKTLSDWREEGKSAEEVKRMTGCVE